MIAGNRMRTDELAANPKFCRGRHDAPFRASNISDERSIGRTRRDASENVDRGVDRDGNDADACIAYPAQ
jgi:hypothetical protein